MSNAIDGFNASETHVAFTKLFKLDANASNFMSIQHVVLKSNAIEAHILFNLLSMIHYMKSSSPQEAHRTIFGVIYKSVAHDALCEYLHLGEDSLHLLERTASINK